MMIPVRCFTCGKVIGSSWEKFKEKREEGEEPGEILDDLEIERYCCRRIFIAHQDLIDEIAPYH
ncbi:DNA-directed RNA polymerase subunit N [Methanonatronarchaeum sp. AMET6-2]|uniref:DNA-directed RNA polymerase subunit N n=1 Tax=Methanonatronarchaeum sp. AMET6-2 TaxID=2933293 RepID=UPI001207451A|nr:DNA-directed RNA polymerase subunit N [Methanonatronarchaeum sp. AMET6-2]RZN61901.1 MAG: DNA-directed RNA polymerase subunit N [Methanonatronarchaeia archaeon]UOY10632.1 DNA-directed RNA polymerase subunit N [Methanonatronarchaeum sp. AMET6-2]